MTNLAGFIVAILIATAPAAAVASSPAAPVTVQLQPWLLEERADLALTWRLEPIEIDTGETPATDEAPGGVDESRLVEAPAPGSLELELPAGSRWWVTPTGEGYWAPGSLLEVATGGEGEIVADNADNQGIVLKKRFSLYPAGRIQGLLPREEPSEHFPSFGLSFTPTTLRGGTAADPPQTRPPEGEADCSIEEDGRFSCQLPAGHLDLRLHLPGFAPHYRWGLRLAPGSVETLGQLRWIPGASVSGFVVVEGQPHLPPSAWVELAPESSRSPAPGESGRFRFLTHTAVPDSRGHFQFHDVPEGTYRLRVGADRFAPTSLAPVRVFPDRESRLREPLVLRPPAKVEIVVLPPVTPGGTPWKMGLYPAEDPAGGLPEAVRGEAGVDGRWIVEDLTPGLFTLVIQGGPNSRWHHDEVRLEPDQPPLEIGLPLVEVEGTIHLGEEPVRALLWFGGTDGDRKVPVYSDLEGRFEGVLPEEGLWPLTVVFRRNGPTQELAPVTVEAPPGGGPAELDLHLPDTHLVGEVVDGEGSSLPQARVTVIHLDHDGHHTGGKAVTDDRGAFELKGLAEATYKAYASYGDAISEEKKFRLREDGEPTEIHLTVRKPETLLIRVASERGPAVGALLTVRPEAQDPGKAQRIHERVLGPTGRTEIPVPADTVALHILVQAPGTGVALRKIPFRPGEEIQIRVGALTGDLLVEMPMADSEGRPLTPILFHGAAWSALSTLASSTLSNSTLGSSTLPNSTEVEPSTELQEWRVTGLEIGEYVVCPRFFIGPECATGYLAPNGELSLQPKAP